MVSRVVLGCGTVGQRLVSRLADRGGVRTVVCGTESRVEALRSEGVDATVANPTDVSVLADLPAMSTVIVAADSTARNREIATVARDRYPGAFLVVLDGMEATDADLEAVSAVADVVLDPEPALVDSIADQVVGERAEDTRRLRSAIRGVDGELAVVMHDNPDPDAIASAVALAMLSEALGTPATPCYFGEISHQENRAMVNLLDLELEGLASADAAIERFAGFALVDHSRPGVNDQLPEDLDVDVVIDHHPPRGGVPAVYADLRADVGATSTLVLDHLHRYGIVPSSTVATALMYGIRVDTDDFAREVSKLDFEAAASILPSVDEGLLARIESPSVSGDTMSTFATAIEDREVRGSVLVSCVGRISDRDALPQAADKLLTMEGITTVLVYGLMGDDVFMSARARGTNVDLGETLRMAFDHIGSAGGHADMAGAQVPFTHAFGEFEDDADRLAAIRGVVTEAFFDALQERPSRTAELLEEADSVGFEFDGVLEND
jgi:nanoRNase/pAp phosphatase (c-di-AMP/oligoRNAs hydrolase)